MSEQVHVNDLFQIIGQQQVELVVLRHRLAQLLQLPDPNGAGTGVSDSVAERPDPER